VERLRSYLGHKGSGALQGLLKANNSIEITHLEQPLFPSSPCSIEFIIPRRYIGCLYPKDFEMSARARRCSRDLGVIVFVRGFK